MIFITVIHHFCHVVKNKWSCWSQSGAVGKACWDYDGLKASFDEFYLKVWSRRNWYLVINYSWGFSSFILNWRTSWTGLVFWSTIISIERSKKLIDPTKIKYQPPHNSLTTTWVACGRESCERGMAAQPRKRIWLVSIMTLWLLGTQNLAYFRMKINALDCSVRWKFNVNILILK